MIKRLLLKLSILLFCFSFHFINVTNAVFIDSAEITNNAFTTGSWEADPPPVPPGPIGNAPTTTLLVSGSPDRRIENQIENSGFEEGVDEFDVPTDWDDAGGDMEVTGEDEIYDPDDGISLLETVSPRTGDYMAKIGRQEDFGNYYEYNYLSQTFPNEGKNLSFWYNFYTFDYDFDQPGLAVSLSYGSNTKQIFQMWAEDIGTDRIGGELGNSGWQQYFYDISHIDNEPYTEFTLDFYAGNSIDDVFQSWLYLDQVTTDELVVNNSNEFNFDFKDTDSPEGDVTVYYQFGNWGDTNCDSDIHDYNDLGAFNWDEAKGNMLCYWGTDGVNEELPHKAVHVVYDNTAPDQISDLSIVDYGDGSFTLDWTAPDDIAAGQATEYDVRYSTTPITDEDTWGSATSVSDLLLDGIPAPRIAGAEEILEIDGLTPGIPYWFAIKSSDAVPNWSEMAVVSNEPKIVINEVYYHGGSDDEFVELYNTSDASFFLSGWTISDNFSTDTIPDLTIEANGFAILVADNNILIALHASADPETPVVSVGVTIGNNLALNDRLILKNSNGEIQDQLSWGDDNSVWDPDCDPVADGHSLARDPLGNDTNLPSDFVDTFPPNPGTNPHSHLNTQIDFQISEDKRSVKFTASGISPYSKLEYEIFYEPSNRAPQGIGSSIAIEGQNEITKDGLMLGTDSSGDWIWDTGMDKIYLKIILTGNNISDRIIEKEAVYQ